MCNNYLFKYSEGAIEKMKLGNPDINKKLSNGRYKIATSFKLTAN